MVVLQRVGDNAGHHGLLAAGTRLGRGGAGPPQEQRQEAEGAEPGAAGLGHGAPERGDGGAAVRATGGAGGVPADRGAGLQAAAGAGAAQLGAA
ncbi:MAG: hypothetical protein ACK559_01715, partial [bacterium]